jgi:hypothetical protein
MVAWRERDREHIFLDGFVLLTKKGHSFYVVEVDAVWLLLEQGEVKGWDPKAFSVLAF